MRLGLHRPVLIPPAPVPPVLIPPAPLPPAPYSQPCKGCGCIDRPDCEDQSKPADAYSMIQTARPAYSLSYYLTCPLNYLSKGPTAGLPLIFFILSTVVDNLQLPVRFNGAGQLLRKLLRTNPDQQWVNQMRASVS